MPPSRDVPELSLGKFILGIGPNVRDLRENYVTRPAQPRRRHFRQSSAPIATEPPAGSAPPPSKEPSDEKSAGAKKSSQGEKDAKPQVEASKGKSGNGPGGLSEGQDKKLRELKAADEGGKKNKGGKAWKDIAEEMGFEAKDIGMLKTRWRELEAGAANGTGSGAVGKDDANEKGIASDQKKTKSGGSGVENNAKMPLLVPAIPTTGQIEVSPDDTFSVDDLALLIHILRRDQAEMWLRASARFFDKTGRRLHPDELETRFTGKVRGISYNFGKDNTPPAGEPRAVVNYPSYTPFVIVDKDGKYRSGGGKGSKGGSTTSQRMTDVDVLDQETMDELDGFLTQGHDDGVRRVD